MNKFRKIFESNTYKGTASCEAGDDTIAEIKVIIKNERDVKKAFEQIFKAAVKADIGISNKDKKAFKNFEVDEDDWGDDEVPEFYLNLDV